MAAPAPQTVDVGPIDAILDNQAVTNDKGGDRRTDKGCLTYSPQKPGDPNHGDWVSTPDTTWSRGGHGALQGWGTSIYCTFPTLDSKQSIVSVSPGKGGSVTLGTPFLLGSLSHANNGVENDGTAVGNAWYFGGDFSFRLNELGHTVTFPWLLMETRDNAALGCPTGPVLLGMCDDRITFLNGGESNPTVTIDGAEYRMVVSQVERLGVDRSQNTMEGTPCPATPTNRGATSFLTKEEYTTKACVYATLVQERTLTVKKSISGADASTTQGFAFTATSTREASPWLGNGATFSLKGGESTGARGVLAGEKLTLTEGVASDPSWRLSGMQCVDGLGVPLGNTVYDIAQRTLTLDGIPQATTPEEAPITCTFTNTYGNEASLTLVKKVVGGDAAPSDWTLTARRNGTTLVSGASGVVKAGLAPGDYSLGETGPKGYVADGWSCVSNGGGTAPQVAGDTVTLGNRADVTCTVTNVFTQGTFTVEKTLALGAGVQAPVAFTQPSPTFPLSYQCTLPDGSTKSGKLAVTIGTPAVSPEMPVGTACSVTEGAADTLPTFANSSYSWSGVEFTVGGKPATDVNGRTVSFAISGDQPGVTKTVAVRVVNSVAAAGLTVRKVDEAGNLLDGAGFVVCRDVSGAKACDLPAMATPSMGQFTLAPLAPGGYWLQERTAPNGYAKLPDWVRFSVAADGAVTIAPESRSRYVSAQGRTIVVTNFVKPVEILKVSGGDETGVALDGSSFLVFPRGGSSTKLPVGAVPVAGATYRVNPADVAVYEALAQENPTWKLSVTADATVGTGLVAIDGLKESVSYLLVEMVAPRGHSLLASPVPFRIGADRAVVLASGSEATASDNRIVVSDYAVVDLPFAGGTASWWFATGAIVLLAAVAWFIARRRADRGRSEQDH